MRALLDHVTGRVAALGAAVLLATAPAAQELTRYDAATFFETTSISGGSFSHDGKRLLVSSDASGVFNAYAVDVGSGKQTQLTSSDTNAFFAVSWFPKDDRFLVTHDSGGDELNHLLVISSDGSMVDVTPGENLKASFAGWRNDDKAFFVISNQRDPRYFDLYRVDVPAPGKDAAYPLELVFENEGFEISAVSRDGQWVALTKRRNNADSDVYLLELGKEGAEPQHLTPHEGDISYSAETFTPKGNALLISADDQGEFRRVLAYELEYGTTVPVITADWDVSFVRYSKNGRYRIHGVNADARTVVKVVDIHTGRELPMPSFESGDVGQVRVSDDATTISFYVNGDTSPSNLYLYDVEKREHRRLTDTLSSKMDEADLVASTVVRYDSFDGLKIPALLYRPKEASADSKVPAIVFVHGGPGGQSRTGYRPTIQHLVNHGYAILAVNNRGSSGYGKAFFHMDDKRHGDVDLKDCIWARRYLEGLEWVDGERVAIMGGSYGGYMVAAALAFAPEEFDAGIDIFGVTNFLRTLEEIPPWWEDFKEALYAEMGDPTTDADRIRAMSPLFHADNIEKPLLVVQGANDPRVKKIESDELVSAVRAKGVPVEYVLFEDEGHGFRKKTNRIEAQEAYLQFLNRYLQRP